MWHTFVHLLLVLAWWLCPVASQAQQYALSYHDQSEGLGNLSVTALAQDRQGYLWVGTDNGLYRYDGAAFVRQGGPEVHGVMAMLVAPDGQEVWVGTPSGLFLVRGGQTTPIRMDGERVTMEPGNNLVAVGEGHILVASIRRVLEVLPAGSGAWRVRPYFDAAMLAAQPELKSVTSVWQTRDARLWLACGKRLCRLSHGQVAVLNPSRAPVDEGGWSEFLEDSRGDLWLRSSTQVLQLRQGATDFIDRTPPQAGGVAAVFTSPIVEDREGRILTRVQNGIARWQGGQWEQIDERQGLSAPGGATAMLVDRQGDLWLGTSGRGLAQWLGYRHLVAWSKRDGLASEDVWSFLRDQDGPLHMGTGAGVWQMIPASGRIGRELSTAAAHQVGSMARDGQGNLWIADFSGELTRVARGSSVPKLVAKFPMIFRLFADSLGRVWIGTQKGLFVIDPARGDRAPRQVDAEVNPNPDHGPRVYSGCEAAGHSFWFTTDQGLWHGDGQHLQRVVVQTPGGKSPASLAFEVLACDGTGGAWLGGGDAGGLWQLRQRGPGWEIAQAMPPHLENLLVVGLLHDRRGWLWASTDAGVHVWNGLRWRSFNRDNGLVWNDANLNALYEDADGSIWVGTSRGAQHITQPEAIFETVQRTAPVLTMARGEQVIDVAAPVALAWAGPPLKLSFASPWFEGRRAESFHYRVLGLDDVWAVSASAELTLSSLAPGDYRLEVVSENADRQTRSPVASVSFSIHAPWWRTPAFYALCLLALAALAWGLHRWRMGQQAQRQRYLEGLVALHARDEAWRAVVEHSADGIVRYDRQCRRIYANPAIRATYDFPTDQVLNKTASEASSLPADQALALVRAIRQVLESGQPQEMEVWYASPLDERHWGHMRLVPEFAQDGRVASVLAVTRDITSIKKTEAHLRQSQLLLRQLAARNETVRDDERKHLAREIHDELGQQLLALRMGVSVLDIQFGSVNPVLRARTLRLTEIVDSTIKVVRNVVTSLRPNALDMGIVSALEWLVGEAFAEAGIEFDLQVRENDIQLDDARATAIFRITQESLTNIVRHAHATRVTVRLERRDTNYWLEIRDNGCGFDPALRKESAFGLVSIRERGHMLGGSVEIASAPGEATSIRVAFPIHNIAHGGAS